MVQCDGIYYAYMCEMWLSAQSFTSTVLVLHVIYNMHTHTVLRKEQNKIIGPVQLKEL